MKGDIGIWMYVLAGLLVSAIILSQAYKVLKAIPSHGDPWPLYEALRAGCERNVSLTLYLQGPFSVNITNETFCHRGMCKEIGCNYTLAFSLPKGSFRYGISIEDGEVELWPLSQT